MSNEKRTPGFETRYMGKWNTPEPPVQMGVDLAKNGDFSAVSLASTKDKLSGLALAMLAGARAIETSRRCYGATYVRDPFGEQGVPMELPYFKAAEILRTQGERMLALLGEG